MNSTQILYAIKQAVTDAQSILITGQGDPDGDSLGSELALYDILRQQKQADSPEQPFEIVISNDMPAPGQYNFFPQIELIKPCEQIRERRFDVGFVLDAGTDRIGEVFPVLQACRTIITIDHHQSRAQGIEHISWIEPQICSVAEMMYDFFVHPAWHLTLTPEIAACLYGGIIYDTGSFRYPNTTPKTLRIAATLVATGFDFSDVAEKLFLERPYSSVRLLRAALNTLQRDGSGEIAWASVTQQMLQETQAQLEETDGIITHYAFIRDAKVAVLFKETSAGEVKISFRARGALDLGRFAKSLTSRGGGHARAAGCTLQGTIADVRGQVIHALQKALLD